MCVLLAEPKRSPSNHRQRIVGRERTGVLLYRSAPLGIAQVWEDDMTDLGSVCTCTPLDSSGWPASDEHTREAHQRQWWCQGCGESVVIVVFDPDGAARHIVRVVARDGIQSHYACGPVVDVPEACTVKGCMCDQWRSLESQAERAAQ